MFIQHKLPVPPSAYLLATTILLSISMNLTIDYSWYFTSVKLCNICLFVAAYFSQHSILKVQPNCSMYQNILFKGTPFFVDGPLGCFYLLANISNVAMNMSVQIFA